MKLLYETIQIQVWWKLPAVVMVMVIRKRGTQSFAPVLNPWGLQIIFNIICKGYQLYVKIFMLTVHLNITQFLEFLGGVIETKYSNVLKNFELSKPLQKSLRKRNWRHHDQWEKLLRLQGRFKSCLHYLLIMASLFICLLQFPHLKCRLYYFSD